jgi:hypothetical protein
MTKLIDCNLFNYQHSKSNIYYFVVFLFIFINACSKPSKEELLATLINSYDSDEIIICSKKIQSLGAEGIPLFLSGINEANKDKYNSGNYVKLGIILTNLNEMASQDIYTLDEVSVLLNLLNSQIDIQGTLITAKTLNLITKVDVGYNDDFVNQYNMKDEDKRQKMISNWRRWYAEQVKPSENRTKKSS